MRVLPCCLAVICVVAPAFGGPSAPLRYRWKPGEVVRYRITARITGSMPLFQSPEPIDLDATLRTVFRARVIAADAQSATLAVGVESADAEVANIPLSVPMEQVQKIISLTVRLAANGDVTNVTGGEPLPFDLAIPGVDPKRLYALMFPVVFPDGPPKKGEEWDFASELLGGKGSAASFRATLKSIGQQGSGGPVLVGTRFAMPVDQQVPAKEARPGEIGSPAKDRKGEIEGEGSFRYSSGGARLRQGQVEIRANLVERLLGPAPAPEAPTETRTKITARIDVRLEPASKPARTTRPSASSARKGR